MSASAEIIPFPSRAPRSPRPEGDRAGAAAERLGRALAALGLALAEQRTTVGAWRDGLAVLTGSVAGLDRSLCVYRGRLTELRDGAAALHGEARRLEARAGAALSAAQPGRESVKNF